MFGATQRLTALALFVSTTAIGCGSETPAPANPPPPPPPAPTTSAQAAPSQSIAATPPPPPRPNPFQNPGGMWEPGQLAEQAESLRKAGWQLDPRLLTEPTQPPLGAVVSLGGCTASFVSPDGLIVTNHHCVVGTLQYATTKLAESGKPQNLIENGYVAKTRGDELWAGPTQKVYVTRSFKDVTKDVRDGLEKLKSDAERHDKIEERTKALVAACEKGRPEVRCNVASYFGGASYKLIEQLEIRDVRLVYAPHERVGDFGGEVDNWQWPRHSGDFAFYRAYVGKDQKPADHAADNVPYQPPHYLRLASEPLKEGDFVMVAGYPGVTNRLRTGAEVEEMVSWEYPRRIEHFEEWVQVLEGLAKKDEKLAVKANPFLRGVANSLKKTKGLLDGLGKGGLAQKRAKMDADLKAWIDADPQRKKAFGDVLPQMEKLFKERSKTRAQDAALGEIGFASRLLGAALTIVHLAEEREKPDEKREPAFQERNWKRIEQGMVRLSSAYDRQIDTALLTKVLERALKVPEKERPAFVGLIFGKGKKADAAGIAGALDELYGKTKLSDEKERMELLKAKLADLKKSTDPMIKLALELRPLQKAVEKREDAFDGAMVLLRPRYLEALRQMGGAPLAPDANGTLRITYGSVRGYSPKPGAPAYVPFTKISEMVAKATGKVPFDAPARVLDAAKAKKFGNYVDPWLGEVPVDFLSDLDITGGNSGSPTLNAKGELVGLAFDGNYEAMASDVIFLPEITRTIHVDLRYMLWMLDAVDGADNILNELGVKPSVD